MMKMRKEGRLAYWMRLNEMGADHAVSRRLQQQQQPGHRAMHAKHLSQFIEMAATDRWRIR